MKPTHIFLGSVYLLPASERDAERLLEIHDPEMTKKLSFFAEPLTVEREREYLRAMIVSASDFLWTVRTRGELIGTAGLHEVDKNMATARLGVIIWNREFQGRGYGSDAIRALCDYAFSTLGINRVFVNVLEANRRGRAYYARFGFTEEGVLREAYVRNGEALDVVHMSFLKREWKDLNNKELR